MTRFFSRNKAFAAYVWQAMFVISLCAVIFFIRPFGFIALYGADFRQFYFDKLVHFGAFFVLTWTCLNMLVATDAPRVVARMRFSSKVAWVCVLSLMLGAGVEWLQALVTYRQGTLGDFYSHLLGSGVALMLFLRYNMRHKDKASTLLE